MNTIVDILEGSNGGYKLLIVLGAWGAVFGGVLILDYIQNRRKRGKRKRTNTD